MLTGLIQGLRSVAHVGASAVRVGLRRASRPFPLVGGLVGDMTRSRSELIAENALLRQQLIVASRATKRPVFLGHERGLLVLLARFVPLWRSALLLVKPETVLRWHREGFRLWWRGGRDVDDRTSLASPRTSSRSFGACPWRIGSVARRESAVNF